MTRIIIKSIVLSLLLISTVTLSVATQSAEQTASASAKSVDPLTFDELKSRIRTEHPRLFINRTTLPQFRKYAQTVCADRIANLKRRVAQYPTKIELEYRTNNVDLVDGRIVFKRVFGDQNTARDGIKYTGGAQALECAIIYLATGEKKYCERALEYLRLNIQFIEMAKHSNIMPEWYHSERLAAIIAWDWLYNEMTVEQRRDFIVPMLEYVDFMRRPGYQRNSGDATTGNYGEPGLLWFAGLAAFKDGFCDELAEKLLRDGYKTNIEMMAFREKVSAGRGLLSSITSGYSFGAYPWASYNFLHTLRSAADFDGTAIWTQMRDFADYFYWMAIPCDTVSAKFLDFGWGDSGHDSNVMYAGLMYTHLAQALHFYGKNSPRHAERIRAVMNLLPKHIQTILGTESYPYVPFILFNFNPKVKNERSPEKILGGQVAQFFPSYGLMNVRSGITADDTYASFKAGAVYDGHQHYDENSFIIYKKGFQALDTGTRGLTKEHLIYYPQTVAHNAILIRAKDEPLANYWYPANAPKIPERPKADGGQNRKKVARSLGFEQNERFAVAAGDATSCYDKAKCAEAIRFFVFVKPDYFIVYDRVQSVGADRQKVFLLHTQNEPKFANSIWRSTAGAGSLFLRTILPEAAETKLIGGEGHEFETNGVNYPLFDAANKKLNTSPNWYGRWRLEISGKQSDDRIRFLHLLQAADANVSEMVPARYNSTSTEDGVEFKTRDGETVTVLFAKDGAPGGRIRILDRKNQPVLEKVFFAPKR